jgi:SAM-dependent methyltransferase
MYRASRHGFDVYGCDLSLPAINFARATYGFDVELATPGQLTYPDGFFDVITMTAVIEHVLKPNEVLEHCWRLLRGGGRLLIETDNVDGLSRLALGTGWPFFTPPYHLQNFSRSGLRALVEQCGFEVLDLYTPHGIAIEQVQHRVPIPRFLFSGPLAVVNWFAERAIRGELIALTAMKSIAR